jgi:hypothetical protein
MNLYTKNGSQPIELPNRIRFSDGTTRTDSSTYTSEEIVAAGYVLVDDKPTIDPATQVVEWDGVWVIRDLPEEIEDSEEVRLKNSEDTVRRLRNTMLNEIAWRIERSLSQTRLGITPTEDIADLDNFAQELRDITKQEGFPDDVTWPETAGDVTFWAGASPDQWNPEQVEGLKK